MMRKPSPVLAASTAVCLGAALAVVGLLVLFGPGWALLVSGVALVAAGLLADLG